MNSWMVSAIVGILLILSSSLFARNKVIYGDDNRLDLFEATDGLHLQLAQSTAAQIGNSTFIDDGVSDYYTIKGGTLQSGMNLCADERFANQTAVARCSGFLVGPDLLVTAGHCVTKQSDCDGFKWAFDYNVTDEGRPIISTLLKKNGQALIIADHGNAEEMINLETRAVDKEHSNFPVPLILAKEEYKNKFPARDNGELYTLKIRGALVDVAPTILAMLGLEKPESMIDEIAAGFVGDESRNSIVENRKWEALIDRKKAIEKALKMAKAGDIVLIAGRGHEKYQDFAGKKIPLDDKEVVKEILG